jgi:uncharacterized damage-inducible protein DinB
MNPIDPILMELSHEMATTRRLLERIPDAHLTWQPHVKSMSLARLGTHIAEIPGWIASILDKDGFEVGGDYTPKAAGSAREILAIFEAGVAGAEAAIRRQNMERLSATWRLTKGGQVIVEMPRMGVIRSLFLNHLIHHRGQLSVYLRLKDVPLPSIYGPSADQPM